MSIRINDDLYKRVKIGDILKIMHGRDQKSVVNKNGNIPIYGTGGLLGFASEFLYNNESVLIGRKGTIDKPFYLDSPFWTVDTLFYSVPKSEISVKYIYYLFCLIDWYQYNEASGVPSLNAKTIENIEIPLPPISEQRRIAEVLSDMDGLIGSMEKLLEKKRMIRQGMMQRLLTPQPDWEVKRLGEIAEIVGGGTPPTGNSDYWNGDISWFTPTEIGKEKYVSKSIRKITDEGLNNCSARILPKGTILLTTRAGIGDVAILLKDATTNQGFQSLVPKEITDSEFLYYYMSSITDQLLSLASGSTFLEISPKNLASIKVSMPSLHIQKSLSQLLANIDRELSVLEIKIKKYQNIKQGMMQKLLTGEIRL